MGGTKGKILKFTRNARWPNRSLRTDGIIRSMGLINIAKIFARHKISCKGGWRDGSAVKSVCGSFRGPEFSSWLPNA